MKVYIVTYQSHSDWEYWIEEKETLGIYATAEEALERAKQALPLEENRCEDPSIWVTEHDLVTQNCQTVWSRTFMEDLAERAAAGIFLNSGEQKRWTSREVPT